MRLLLLPLRATAKSIISYLYVDGKFQCFVLEPPNPIPAGAYEIKLEHSNKFQRIMPVLQNVPGHTAIEIHWGNTAADTKDCLIVGKIQGPDFVGESVDAFNELFPLMQASTEPISISVTRAAPLPEQPAAPVKGDVKVADPTPTPAPSGKLTLTNHAPVTASLVAGAATSVLIALGRAKFGLDLSGQEGNLTLLIGALVGYLTKGAIE